MTPDTIARIQRSREIQETVFRTEISKNIAAERHNEALGRKWATNQATWEDLNRWDNPHLDPGELQRLLPDDVQSLIIPRGSCMAFKAGVIAILTEFEQATRH